MRLDKILSIVPIAAVILVVAAPAQAQGGIGFGFTKFGRRSAFSFGISSGFPCCAPAPVVVVERHWVPAHYETRCEQVWVPGCTRQVYVEPVYDSCVDPCGNVTRVLVREGHYRTIETPGRYETRHYQVWVPGYYI